LAPAGWVDILFFFAFHDRRRLEWLEGNESCILVCAGVDTI